MKTISSAWPVFRHFISFSLICMYVYIHVHIELNVLIFFFTKQSPEFDGWIGDKIIPKMKNKNSLISFLNGLF